MIKKATWLRRLQITRVASWTPGTTSAMSWSATWIWLSSKGNSDKQTAWAAFHPVRWLILKSEESHILTSLRVKCHQKSPIAGTRFHASARLVQPNPAKVCQSSFRHGNSLRVIQRLNYPMVTRQTSKQYKQRSSNRRVSVWFRFKKKTSRELVRVSRPISTITCQK